jgi:8-oxo-dGTP diphosphatase
LTYPIDRYVLAEFARVPVATRTVMLIRHAKAGKRAEYRGDDRTRPLDKIGRRHARDAAVMLASFVPQRVLSADLVRCEQTVQPLADRLGLPVQSAPEFSDEFYLRNPAGTRQALFHWAEQPGASAICSQGEAIPGLLADLAAPAVPYQARKGSLWVLSLLGRRVVTADYYPHPTV